MNKIIGRIKDLVYFYGNLEVTEWQGEKLFIVWVGLGFKLVKIAITDKDIKKSWIKKIKKCWELSDYYTIRDGSVYAYSLNNKNILHRQSI